MTKRQAKNKLSNDLGSIRAQLEQAFIDAEKLGLFGIATDIKLTRQMAGRVDDWLTFDIQSEDVATESLTDCQ